MKLPLLLLALGFTSMVSQVLLMRELVVVFYGNELSLGIMLGSWLFWVGTGSYSGGIILPRARSMSRFSAVALLQVLLGLLSFATFLALRMLPLILRQETAGEVIGYVPIAITSFLLLAPLCLLLGFLFTLFCHLHDGEEPVTSIGRVYFFEGLGAAAGGIIFALVLVRFLDPVTIVFLLFIMNLAAAAFTLALISRPVLSATLLCILFLAVSGSAFFGIIGTVKERSLAWLWRGLHVVDSGDSIYGNVTYIEREGQRALYENGLLIASHPDQFSAEEAVHFALLEHAKPKRVLLIGGGASGSVDEILKHSVDHVDYVELDPLIIEMITRYFPPDARRGLEDPRVTIHNIDGRLFINRTRESYDVIIINLPDPYTAQLNRFYTDSFFRTCAARLKPGGVLSFRLSSAENYISPELQQFIGCMYRTLREVFPEVKVIPGETNVFIAAAAPNTLTLDAHALIRRLSERAIQQQVLFVREYYLPHRLSEDRLQMLAAALSVEVSRRNTDLAPVCYFYDAVLWSKQFKDFSSSVLVWFSKIPPAILLAAVAVFFAGAAFVQMRAPRFWGPKSILVAVGTTGFAEITVEVVTLLGFQAIHGYVYHKIAIIITFFMVGLALGAASAIRYVRAKRSHALPFLVVQGTVCLYPLLLLGALVIMTGGGASSFFGRAQSVQAAVVFPALAFAAGLIGGLQFPLANALWLAEVPGTARAAGFTYGVDLFGSCAGAFLAAGLLIPVFGIPFACGAASLLNAGSFILVFLKIRQGFKGVSPLSLR